ncbi:hypothetical protein PSTG_14277 [Puccinia striiformis f. sp. tritici PST-78]|uniref:CSC1/OSCA1-like 7TM region domain-containing protein n=2 Tax=Puccinia striiformis f. sp. tritici PST-78 TaxID=1165861 RepID=A0A0L0UZ42_9BASI|nr:hypothetical protein PSTG_14277 [Puccinia striiformis f. sp. tritici PST-78]
MLSFQDSDPVALGILSSIFISLFLTAPLLWIFFRTRSRPSSFTWKAIYVPRTWWPGPSHRVHSIFGPFWGGSLSHFLLMLLKGSAPQQPSSPKPSSRQSPNDDHSIFMTDEEIHLRFLALCLRLALLALLLGLPTFFALYITGVPPPSPDSLKFSSVQNFTVLRLLYQYDLTPESFSTRLIIWSIAALVIGVILAFTLILFEWRHLRKNLQRFSREKCGGLQIVYFPRKPDSGFKSVGEKKMANWVRACGLGPVGQEGSGEAVQRNPSPQQSRKNSTEEHPAGLDSDTAPLRASDSSKPKKPNSSRRPSARKSQVPLRSEHRGVIIHGIFTISQLEGLYSLSEKRRKVLDDLELNESKYVAGFLPVNTGDPPTKKSKRHNKARNRNQAEESGEGQVTPYGPVGLYKLDAQPREASSLGWDDSSLRLSRVQSDETLRGSPERFGHGEPEIKSSKFRFDEVMDDLHLTNDEYQVKWAIGNEVTRQDDGTFHNVTQGKPASLKFQKIHPPDLERSHGAELVDEVHLVEFPSAATSVAGTPTSLLPPSDAGSRWPQAGRSTPSSFASTEDTHGYPPPSSTAPTSASLSRSNSRQTLKEHYNHNLNVPAVTLSDLVQQESGRGTRLSFPSELTGKARLAPFHPLTQSISSPNLARAATPARSIRGVTSQTSEGSDIIPYLFELPETITNQDMRPTPPIQSVPTIAINHNNLKSKIPMPTIRNESTPTIPPKRNVKPHRFIDAEEIEMLYHSIRKNRSQLKRINQDFLKEKRRAVEEMEEGLNGSVSGWILVGKGVELIEGALPIDGMTREDINWHTLGKKGRIPLFWLLFLGIFLIVGIIIIPVTVLSMAAMPELPTASPIFVFLRQQTGLSLGLISITIPSLILFMSLYPSLSAISYLAINFSGLPSKAAAQLLSITAIFILISGCFMIWFLVCASLIDLPFHTEVEEGDKIKIVIMDRFSRGILALSDSFLSFQAILAIIVPTILLTQPDRWKKVRRALRSVQTPRQRALSLWPHQMNSALCRGSSLMGITVLLLFSSIAPLIIIPSVVFFVYMMLVQQRNVRFVYKRDSQSGGKTELQMILMLSILLALHSMFLAVILASRQRWALTALAGMIGLSILIITCLMIYHDSTFGGKRSLPSESKRALEVFEAGPGGTEYESSTSLNTGQSSTNWSSSPGSKKDSLLSIFQLLNTKLRSSEVKSTRLVPLPSESYDDLVDTRLALRTYPDAPPHLPYLNWGSSSHVHSRDMLYPPVLLQTSPAVWLPKNGIAAEEAYELKKYWDLDAFHEEGISTQQLNLI